MILQSISMPSAAFGLPPKVNIEQGHGEDAPIDGNTPSTLQKVNDASSALFKEGVVADAQLDESSLKDIMPEEAPAIEHGLDQLMQRFSADPSQMQLGLHICELYTFLGKRPEALKHIEVFLKHFPDNTEALLKKGDLLFSLKRYYEARSIFFQIIVIDHCFLDAWRGIVSCETLLDHLSEFRLEQERNLQRNPTDWQSLFFLALSTPRATHKDHFVKTIRKCLKLKSKEPLFHLVIADALGVDEISHATAFVHLKLVANSDSSLRIPALMQLAQHHIDRSDADAALVYLEQILVLKPNHVPAMVAKCETLLLKDQPELALPIIERIFTLQPMDPDGWALKCRYYQSVEDPDRALRAINYSIRIYPTHKPYYHIRAELLFEEGHYEAALEDFDRSDLIVSQHAVRALQYMKCVRKTKTATPMQVTKAIVASEALIKIEPDCSRYFYLRAKLHFILAKSNKNYNKRLDRDLKKVIAHESSPHTLFTKATKLLAEYRVFQGDDQDALKYYNSLVVLRPDDLALLSKRRNLLMKQKKYLQVEEELSQLMLSHPEDYTLYLERAKLYMNKGKASAALSDLLQAKSLNAPPQQYLTMMGDAYLETFEQEKALKSFHEALRIDSNNYDALRGLGRIYLFRKYYKNAEKYLLRAYLQFPKAHDKTLLYLVSTLACLKKLDLAAYYVGFAKKKKYPEVHLHGMNAELCFVQHDYDKALFHVQKYLEAFPRDLHFIILHADILVQKENYSSAMDILRQAHALFPNCKPLAKMIDERVPLAEQDNQKKVSKHKNYENMEQAKVELAIMRTKKLELMEWQIKYSTYMLKKA